MGLRDKAERKDSNNKIVGERMMKREKYVIARNKLTLSYSKTVLAETS